MIAVEAAPSLWSVERAAESLSITPRFLYTLVSEGSIKSIRIGRRVLIPDAELRRVATEGVTRAEEPVQT